MSIPVITLLTILLCAGILISGLLAVLLDNMLSAIISAGLASLFASAEPRKPAAPVIRKFIVRDYSTRTFLENPAGPSMFDSPVIRQYHHRHVRKAMDQNNTCAGCRRAVAGLQQLPAG